MEIKSKIGLFIIMVWCCLFCNCKKNGSELVTEERPCGTITTIIIYDNVDVILTNRFPHAFRVEAPQNLMEKIETSINGTTLTVRNNNTFRWLHDLDPSLTVWVNADSLSDLAFYGTSVLSTETAMERPRLEITIGKSSSMSNGIIDMEVHAEQLNVLQDDGYSDISIHGTTTNLFLKNNSFGPMKLSDMIAENVVVDGRGSNDTYIHAVNSLTGKLSYVGNLYYSGNPETLSVEVTGKGQLIHVE